MSNVECIQVECKACHNHFPADRYEQDHSGTFSLRCPHCGATSAYKTSDLSLYHRAMVAERTPPARGA